jgi:hypothetical protein
MKIPTTHRHRNGSPPLPCRILAYLARHGAPMHYRVMARALRHPRPAYVLNACVAMAHDGRLRWVNGGTYSLRGERP